MFSKSIQLLKIFKWYYYDSFIFLIVSNFQKNPKAFMSISKKVRALLYGVKILVQFLKVVIKKSNIFRLLQLFCFCCQSFLKSSIKTISDLIKSYNIMYKYSCKHVQVLCKPEQVCASLFFFVTKVGDNHLTLSWINGVRGHLPIFKQRTVF